MEMFCSLPVPLSLAETLRMPFAVDVEGHLDLRDAAGGGIDPVEAEIAEHLVVGDELAFALANDDVDAGLVISSRREDLGLLRRDRRVALDHRRGDAAHGLDGEGQRGHIEKDDVAKGRILREHAALDRGTDGDDFIGLTPWWGSLPARGLRGLDDLGHAGHATNEDEFVDVAGGHSPLP